MLSGHGKLDASPTQDCLSDTSTSSDVSSTQVKLAAMRWYPQGCLHYKLASTPHRRTNIPAVVSIEKKQKSKLAPKSKRAPTKSKKAPAKLKAPPKSEKAPFNSSVPSNKKSAKRIVFYDSYHPANLITHDECKNELNQGLYEGYVLNAHARLSHAWKGEKSEGHYMTGVKDYINCRRILEVSA